MNNDEYLKFYADRVKKINNELEIRKNPTDPLLKQCCKCKQVNRTKYNRWLCPYCGSINEPGDKIEGIIKNLWTGLEPIVGFCLLIVLICAIIGWVIITFYSIFGMIRHISVGTFIIIIFLWLILNELKKKKG